MNASPLDLKARLAHPAVRSADLKLLARTAGIDLAKARTKAAMAAILAANADKVQPHLHLLPEIPPDPEKLQTLRNALDTSTKVNRTLGLTFVALMFYILLIVASTTDVQLFLPESKVRLPIIDVELPLLGFYAVVPFVILIFHFHLLVNIKHHQDKYKLWRAEVGEDGKTTQLDPILINFIDSYRRGSLLRFLLVLIIAVSIFYFPLLNIILMQGRFGAYHSFPISTAQFVAVILDAGLILGFFYKVFLRRYGIKLPFLRKIFSLGYLPVVIGFGFGVIFWLLALYLRLALDDIDRWSFLPQEWIPKLDLTNSTEGVRNVDDGYVLYYLKDSLNPEEAKTKAAVHFSKPLNLAGRDFRFAILNGINLARSNMERCRMEYVSMVDGNLEGAKLSKAGLEYANLERVNAKNAEFDSSKSQEINLWGAHLEGANLFEAHLEGAFLASSYLQGADLWGTHLEGAFFGTEGCDLLGYFWTEGEAHLEGADLEGAYLMGADLDGAHLEAAYLFAAHFEGADLRNVHFEGTNLMPPAPYSSPFENDSDKINRKEPSKTHFRGADLRTTFFRCTRFEPEYFDSAWIELAIDSCLVNWDSILTNTEYTNKDSKIWFERRIMQAKQCDPNIDSYQELCGINEEKRLQLLPSIACKNKYIAKGILQQYNTPDRFKQEELFKKRLTILNAMCTQCQPILFEVYEKWPRLVEDAPCLQN